MNGLSLCSGIGGIDLGLRLVVPNYRTICYVEKAPYPQEILLARMADGILDRGPLWDDLATFNAREWKGLIDVVHGGYPCQPFSTASRGRRTATDLWPEFKRIIGECRPRVVFLENVNPSAFRDCTLDLALAGYKTLGPASFTAAELGAPFVRRRYFLFAVTHRHGKLRQSFHAKVAKLPHSDENPWTTLPEDVGMVDGSSHRMDRLKALGNAVIPRMAALAWETLTHAISQIR